jgi:hypothetical protein
MILQAGNPDAMKRKAMRVNREATLSSFNNSTGDKEQKKYRTGFVPLPKDPDAVPAPAMNLWERPVYKSQEGYVRPGANDFLSIKSRGF